MNHQRLLLEARAFAALKQWDNALDLIAVDKRADTARLRADIYWESGNWAIAGQKAEELLATRWSDATPLNADEREEVMRAAVAYSLANDETSLDRLRDHFGPKMKASPDASAFAVVAQRIDVARRRVPRRGGADRLHRYAPDLHEGLPQALSPPPATADELATARGALAAVRRAHSSSHSKRPLCDLLPARFADQPVAVAGDFLDRRRGPDSVRRCGAPSTAD